MIPWERKQHPDEISPAGHIDQQKPVIAMVSTISFSDFIGFFFLNTIIDGMFRFQKFFARFRCFLQNQLHGYPYEEERRSRQVASCNESDRQLISVDDVVVVMQRLGLSMNETDDLHFGGNGLDLCDELSRLFDKKEPSFEELRDAFSVFDENRDGFIDSKEVQKVLRNLGLKEASTVEDCERMIKIHDQNGDGRIDFDEFVKFMEDCLLI